MLGLLPLPKAHLCHTQEQLDVVLLRFRCSLINDRLDTSFGYHLLEVKALDPDLGSGFGASGLFERLKQLEGVACLQ